MSRIETKPEEAERPPDQLAGEPVDAEATQSEESESNGRNRFWQLERWIPGRTDLVLLVVALLPLMVSAVALVLAVGGDYLPVSDHALIELQTRDVGRHEVLVGLYSRADWNHPGPMLFYVLAPFYWLTGGSSIGVDLGALAINAASVAGMGLIARRRGGTPLLICTLLACALLMRTLGAEFLVDPWVCFVTVLPFGLMIFLTWALMCGDTWALPVATVVASFLAQTHVGFVVLALPLLAWGTVWLIAVRRDRWRELLRPGGAAVAIGGVLWAPVALDVLLHAPSNLRRVARWFHTPEEATHTVGEGWRVITGQFALEPEWLVTKQPVSIGGQSPFIFESPTPWLLAVVVVAGWALWRWGGSDDRRLVTVLGVTLILSIAAVVRTVGPAFDYRLRWTWVPPMIGFVLVLWAAVQVVGRRWQPLLARAMVPVAAAALVVVSGINTYTAATAGDPLEEFSVKLEDLVPQVLAGIDSDAHGNDGAGGGQVLVEDPYAQAGGYARGLVLQLERRGIDARVLPERRFLYGEHRVVDDDDPVRARLIIAKNDAVASLDANANLRRIAEWRHPGPLPSPQDEQRLEQLRHELLMGRIDPDEYEAGVAELDLPPVLPATHRVAVFLDLRVGSGSGN